MRTLIVLVFVLAAVTFCQTSQKKLSPQEVEKEILAHEYAMWDRWSTGDPLGFAENFQEDATLFRWHDVQAQARLDGLEEIQEYLAFFKGNIPAHKYEMVDSKVQVYGDIAILTFEYHTTTPDGESDTPWKATHVYRLVNSEWKIVHAHWSLVKSE